MGEVNMRKIVVMAVFCGSFALTGGALAADLPARSDFEAVCDKFGPTNKEFCNLVLGLYDTVDELNGQVGDVESYVGRIPEHPHPAFGYELTQERLSALRADMEAADGDLEKLIGRVPEHPHAAFGYESTRGELAELRAAIEEMKAKQ
jgi:hypothetical protein